MSMSALVSSRRPFNSIRFLVVHPQSSPLNTHSFPFSRFRISSSTPPPFDVLYPFRSEDADYYYFFWPFSLQSTILLILFIIWAIIGLFVAREVLLVVLDHRKIKRKPVTKKVYHGAYSVKKRRFFKDKNYQPVANGGNEQV